MHGRRYSDGIHQAIEAKEGIKVRGEDQTLATITFQNLFRLYDHLAGMTGTAKTEEREFRDIYGLDVVVVPTNMPMVRKDHSDIVYKSERAKFEAVVDEIIAEHHKGTAGVGRHALDREERNARGDVAAQRRRMQRPQREVSRAWKPRSSRTPGKTARSRSRPTWRAAAPISNWAKASPSNGGLHIIGTERHESRRIDNQLRGRSGRQGDPGSSRFYVSLEDEVMRLFGGERMTNIMERVGFTDEQPIESGLVTRSIQRAQSKVEAHNYEIRKHVLEYDDVMNKQRSVIYGDRRAILEGRFDSRTFMLQTLEGKVTKPLRKTRRRTRIRASGISRRCSMRWS